MSRRFWCCVVCFLSVFAERGIAATVEPAIQIEKEQKVVAQRRRIITAQLELTRTFALRDGTGELLDPQSRLRSFSTTRIVVDRDYRRFDETTNRVRVTSPDGSISVPNNKDGSIEQRFVLTPTDFILHDATTYQGQGANPVRMGARGEAGASESKVFSVEMLGLIPMPSDLLFRTNVDAFYEVPDRSDCETDDEDLDGLKTLRSSYIRKDGKRVTFWFAPELDDSIVQTEFSMTFPDGRVRTQRVHSKLEQYGGIWFPAECEYSCWFADKLIDREHWVVKDPVFNASIDPSVFTLAGVDVPLGTLVIGSSDHKLKAWDGQLLTEAKSLPAPQPQPAAPRPRNYLWLAAVNVLAGLFFLGLYFRRRRGMSGSGGTP